MFKLLVFLVAIVAVWGLPQRGRSPMITPATDDRIEDGQNADIVRYPYHLALVLYGLSTCGASLVGSKWALTSAYCAQNALPGYSAVLAGSNDFTSGQLVQVTTTYTHPLFDNSTMVYDIGVLELEEVNIENGSPIALHDSGYIAEEGAEATVTGWGLPWVVGEPDSLLQVVVTKVISNEVCNQSYAGRITELMMCAGDSEESEESPACYADWGGPLVVDGKLYGIATWSTGCGESRWPFISTRVSEGSMREFVRNITGI